MEISKQLDYSKYRRILYIIKDYAYILVKLPVAVRFGVPSPVNGSDEMLGSESLRLSHVFSIEDEVLRFHYVVHEEETSRNAIWLILIGCSRCVHVSTRVH